MPDKYNVSWMSISQTTVSSDNVDHAIMAAMRVAGDGLVETKSHPVMRVENLTTDEITVVSIDKDYKVVKTHDTK